LIKVFRHYVPRLSVFLAAFELSLFFGIILLGASLEISGQWEAEMPLDPPGAAMFAAGIVTVTALMMGATGLYSHDVMFEMDAVLARMALTFSMAFAVFCAFALLLSPWTPPALAQYRIAAGAVSLCALISLALRGGLGRFVKRETLKRRILVVGCGKSAAKIARMDRLEKYRFRVAAYVEFGPGQDEEPLSPLFPGAAIATPEAALALIDTFGVDGIVIASSERRGLPHDALLQCRMRGIAIEDFATFWERHAAHVDLESLQPSWLTYCDGFAMNRGRHIAKICFDYLVAVLLLIFTAPIMLLTALVIKATSPGPVLFRQERVGRNGKIFNVLKFRSMTVDAEKAGPQWAKVNDSRVTAVGRFIRKVRIDELPQIINLLRGEMSFVGPRPERPHFVGQLKEVIPYFDERHRVKPGLSGWAQVNYPYGASIGDAREKLSYDLYYLKNGGLFLDFLILLRTVHVILWPFGAR
jgi:sugar transferase (PEP-CTERM system associated)